MKSLLILIALSFSLLTCSQTETYLEPERPQLHFTAKKGWLNDPNGLIYYDGEYHMFFQHEPLGTDRTHWGHAISTDLLHWEELPIALYPDDLGVCWSGSAVIDYKNVSGLKTGDENVMLAFYTSNIYITEDDLFQQQSIAYSNDKGRTWTKYSGNPILSERDSIPGETEARDPNVFWHEPSQKWVMILFEIFNDEAVFTIYNSSNLIDWEYMSTIPEEFSECPELFELPVDGDDTNRKWVVYDANNSYIIGSFDGKEFTIESGPHRFIEGKYYASQNFENLPNGRMVQIGWNFNLPWDEAVWEQQLSFPTELTLRTTSDGIRLFNEPISEIELLHAADSNWTNLTPEQANDKFRCQNSVIAHIKCEIDISGNEEFSLMIGGDEISYNASTEKFDFSADAEDMEFDKLEFAKSAEGNMKLEFIIDKETIEMFVDNGALTVVLPREKEVKANGISFSAGDYLINTLDYYKMKSIWNVDFETGYGLSVTTEGQGSISLNPEPPKGGYAYGTQVVAKAESENGWQFESWTGDVDNSNGMDTIIMDCNKSIRAKFTMSSSSSTKINENNNDFAVYPNPAKDVIHLLINGFEGLAEANIINLNGSEIYSSKLEVTNDLAAEIPISKLNTGLYVLRVTSENFTKTKRFNIVK